MKIVGVSIGLAASLIMLSAGALFFVSEKLHEIDEAMDGVFYE